MDDAAREAAARAIAEAAKAKRPKTSRIVVGAAVVVTIACAIGFVIGLTRGSTSTDHGHAEVSARTTIPLDGGSVAVAEPGAALVWHGSVVTQQTGEVFYRIAGALEITSRGAHVRAENACVRVVITSSGSFALVEQGRARIGDRVIMAGEKIVLP